MIGLLGAGGLIWLLWLMISPDSSFAKRVSAAAFLAFVVALSSIDPLLDFRARRAIRRACGEERAHLSKIESRKTHYRVHIATADGTQLRKCVVHAGIVKWLR